MINVYIIFNFSPLTTPIQNLFSKCLLTNIQKHSLLPKCDFVGESYVS